ncbi:hypothetical protein D9M71_603970 [compost metagenome]
MQTCVQAATEPQRGVGRQQQPVGRGDAPVAHAAPGDGGEVEGDRLEKQRREGPARRQQRASEEEYRPGGTGQVDVAEVVTAGHRHQQRQGDADGQAATGGKVEHGGTPEGKDAAPRSHGAPVVQSAW